MKSAGVRADRHKLRKNEEDREERLGQRKSEKEDIRQNKRREGKRAIKDSGAEEVQV